MKDWQQRVVDESEELEEKLGKLGEFLESDSFYDLDNKNQELLVKQRDFMYSYHAVLRERIALFE